LWSFHCSYLGTDPQKSSTNRPNHDLIQGFVGEIRPAKELTNKESDGPVFLSKYPTAAVISSPGFGGSVEKEVPENVVPPVDFERDPS
jgi:hypothetical protein